MIENMPLFEDVLKEINVLSLPSFWISHEVDKIKIKCIKKIIYGNLCRK